MSIILMSNKQMSKSDAVKSLSNEPSRDIRSYLRVADRCQVVYTRHGSHSEVPNARNVCLVMKMHLKAATIDLRSAKNHSADINQALVSSTLDYCNSVIIGKSA